MKNNVNTSRKMNLHRRGNQLFFYFQLYKTFTFIIHHFVLTAVTFIPIIKFMKTDRLLLTECVLRKAALFPLFYHLKHLLPYSGITSHDLFFCHAKLSVIIFVSKRWLADGILCKSNFHFGNHCPDNFDGDFFAEIILIIIINNNSISENDIFFNSYISNLFFNERSRYYRTMEWTFKSSGNAIKSGVSHQQNRFWI